MTRTILFTFVFFSTIVNAQVDTSFLYNPSSAFGVLDIRVATGSDQYYYLREDVTFSFREASGLKTNRFLDMTAWNSEQYREGHLRYKSQNADEFVMNYRLLKPIGYQPEYKQGYPIVLLLHGLLERGNCAEGKCYHANKAYSPSTNSPPASNSATFELLNNDYNLIHGGLNYLEASTLTNGMAPDNVNLPPRAFPGFVLVPQNLNGWTDEAVNDALRLLRLMIKKYNIDENSVYINGVSHGGHATYKALVRAPWLFAAGVLFSAADDAGVTRNDNINRIAGVPLWLFQGGKDVKPTQKQTERYVSAMRDAGSEIRYTLYPEIGHGTWNKAFSEPDFFTWMLRRKRNDIHVFANDKSICATTQLPKQLSLPEGFLGYEWEHNGKLLDAKNASISVLAPGSYRARFLEKDLQGQLRWSEWSSPVELTMKAPGVAKVEVTGTRFMPDLNGESKLILDADKGLKYHHWYRDKGLRMKLDDSVRTLILHPGLGDGRYFLKSFDYDKCMTESSDTTIVFFDNRGALSLSRPSELVAKPISASRSDLTWRDNSGNESGFEIWRKQITSSQSKDARWQLVTVTDSNVTSFSDNGLLPATNFIYAIRAISKNGRSEYWPTLDEQQVQVTTIADTEPPAKPTLSDATAVGIGTIKVSWNPAVDNSAIKEYALVLNTDTIYIDAMDTLAIIDSLQANTVYRVSIVAVDVSGNVSASSDALEISTTVNGLYYQHTTGAWQSVSEIDWTLQEFTGLVPNVTLKPKTQDDFFNFRFDGYLHIRKDGIYQFRISSDDGSRMKVGDSLVVMNDGVHNLATTTSPIHLMDSGPHRITIDFFDYDRSDSLLVEYKGPDSQGSWVRIPDEAFTSNTITAVEDKEGLGELSVYPNPASVGKIQIALPWVGNEAATLSVINSTGQLVKSMIIEIQNEPVLTLEDVSMAPGIYIFRVDTADEMRSTRVIIK